ncbi:hypothetical protein D920_02744 [Enterococcus faecalis 13-SD-W-01]|nr:hypothetical protein D920_02744 [Enterococcus faecalis 13-SD-W-01]
MKKIMFLGSFILLLAGCSNPGSNEQESTAESAATSTATSTTERTQTTQSSTSKSTETTSETDKSETQPTGDAMEQLQQKYPNVLLPTKVPVAQNLNIAAAETKQGFSVLYYDLGQKLPLNDQQLNQETPQATYLYRYAFASSNEAVTAMQPFTVDTNAQPVDLGHDITGYQQGAAGSSYLEWTEGNWRLRVRASNIDGQDPVPAAKDIVNYLEENTLPAPEIVGLITLDLADTSNKAAQVSWQNGTDLYTITHHDPLTALEMAVSMNR